MVELEVIQQSNRHSEVSQNSEISASRVGNFQETSPEISWNLSQFHKPPCFLARAQIALQISLPCTHHVDKAETSVLGRCSFQ